MRGAYRETSSFSFHAFTLFKGEGARIYRAPKKYRRTFWEEERQTQRARRQTQCAVCLGALPATRMRVVSSSLLTAPPKNKDGIPSSGAPRQLPPWGEAMHRDVFGTASASYTRSLHLVAFTGLPKSIEELFGKRSGRRNGQNGKRSAPSAMAPWRDEVGMTKAGRLLSLNMNVEEEGFLPPSKILHFTFYILHSTFTIYPPFPFKHIKTLPHSLDFCAVFC